MRRHITRRRVALFAFVLLALGVLYFCYIPFVFFLTFETSCRDEFLIPAWIETNSAGIQDDETLPLSDVDILVSFAPHDVKVSSRISGADGIVPISLTSPYRWVFFGLIPRCNHLNSVKVEPIEPVGFQSLSAKPQPLNQALSFGFIPEENIDLPMPVRDLNCQQFNLPQGDYRAFGLEAMLTDFDESLFYGHDYFGRYIAQTGNLEWFDTDAVLGNDRWIRTIEKSEDNLYWVLIFPKSQPNQSVVSLTFEDGIPNTTSLPAPFPEIIDIAVDDSGTLWAVSSNQLSRWNNRIDEWEYIRANKSDSEFAPFADIVSITSLASGEIAISSFRQIAIGAVASEKNIIDWEVLLPPDDIPRFDLSHVDQNRIWFDQMNIFYDVSTEQWQTVEFQLELGNQDSHYRVGAVETTDDAIWFGSYDVVTGNDILFYVDHPDNADWSSWPLYRELNKINQISAESLTTLWISGYKSLSRCEIHIDN